MLCKPIHCFNANELTLYCQGCVLKAVSFQKQKLIIPFNLQGQDIFRLWWVVSQILWRFIMQKLLNKSQDIYRK